jgi:cell division protein FtsW
MDDSIYRLRHRDILALCVLALLGLGVVMVQSAAMNVTGDPRWQWSQRGTRHLVYALAAAITFFVVGHIDYAVLSRRAKTIWKSPAVLLFAVATFACLAVLIPHVGIEVNGARRWLPLGFVQVQPSELGKWGVVLLLAWWLAHRPVDMQSLTRGLAPTLVPIGIICLLVVIQDFGTAALIGLCALAMLLAGRVKAWHMLLIVPLGLAAAAAFVMSEPYRWRRMTSFLDPWASPRGEGYHMVQSLLSFSTGGMTGRGLGNGIQKLGYLPEDTTDFIFAVICEELGLFGAAMTIALYLGILYVAWQAIRCRTDPFGRLLAFGVATMIGLQSLINIAVATVSVPTKGLSLPLVSAGGSGLIITCGALGLLYSVLSFDHGQGSSEGDLEAAEGVDQPATLGIGSVATPSLLAASFLTSEADCG